MGRRHDRKVHHRRVRCDRVKPSHIAEALLKLETEVRLHSGVGRLKLSAVMQLSDYWIE